MIPRTSSPPTTRPKETHQTGIPVRGALAGATVTFKSDFFDSESANGPLERLHQPHGPAGLGRPERGDALLEEVTLPRGARGRDGDLQERLLRRKGRQLSTLAPLRDLRARASDPAWTRRAVDEGVKSCPRAQCGKSAHCVR